MILAVLSSICVAASPATQRLLARPDDFLEKGARVLERRHEDLDRDGIQEAILVAGLHDPDEEPRADAFNGAIAVHVLQRDDTLWREAGRIELEGVPERIVVADVGAGAERTRLLFIGADHCGASCNGMELHAHALRNGRLVPYLPEETKVWKGWVTVVPGRFVETWTRADEPGELAECCPSAFDVVRLAPRGGSLVPIETAHVFAEEASRAGVTGASGSGSLRIATNAPDSILSAAIVAERDWLVLGGRSIGKIRLGMTPSQVHDLLGPPTAAASRAEGVAVERWGEPNRLLVFFAGEHVTQISVTSSKFHTRDGFRTGDPVAKVREKLGTALETRAAGRRTILGGGSGIAFEISPENGGRVSALIVHGEEADALPLE